MPQLNGGGGDDLGANDEMIPFKDEGEQEEKISENVSAERDLDDVKSSLVNESENNSSSSDSEVRTLHMLDVLHGAEHEQKCDLMVLKVSIVSSPLCVYFPLVSKQRGAPKPDPTQKVMRKQETTSVKVKIIKKPQYYLCYIWKFCNFSVPDFSLFPQH